MMDPKTSEPIQQRTISPERTTRSPERKLSPERNISPTRTTSPKRGSSPRRGDISPTCRGSKRGVSPPQRVRSPSPTKYRTTGKVDIRQNFSQEVEDEINELIHLLMVGGYQCLAMASFFDRDDVGLFGMAHFSKWCSTEVFHCVRLLMDYVVVRGGCVRLSKIDKPSETEWKSPVEGLELMLKMKEIVYEKVVGLHKFAGENKDGHLNDFLESVILRPLVACNRQLVVLVSNLKRAGPALGEYQFNKHLETYLQTIMSNPNLSYVLHGGIDYLNMYHPPPNTPIDFSTILNQLVGQIPDLTSKLDLTDLIGLVGNINIGNLIKPFRTSYHY